MFTFTKLELEHNVNDMDDPVAGQVVSLYDVAHSQVTGDGYLANTPLLRHANDNNANDADLSGEGGDGEPLPRPGHQRCGPRGEGGGLDVTLRQVSQEGQLELLWFRQQRLGWIGLI